MIKAIETKYKGYRFRSRLEAKWAVFFDALEIEWAYEAEGFHVMGSDYEIRYLPDFYFPDIRAFVEIKPFSDPGQLLKSDVRKIMGLAAHGNLDILVLGGADFRLYRGFYVIGSQLPDPQFSVIDRLQFSTCILCGRAGLYVVPKEEGPSKFYCFNQSCHGRGGLQIKQAVEWHTPQVLEAMNAARSARFEHGETPKVRRGRLRKGS